MVHSVHSKKILYLASSSSSRQSLLSAAQIPFILIGHSASEHGYKEFLPLEERVRDIALLKMQYALLPNSVPENQIYYVLTADTMMADSYSKVYGKPANRSQAKMMLQALRGKSTVSTGFCLDKKVFLNNSWQTERRVCTVVTSQCICDIPDAWIDRYLDSSEGLHASGSLAVEGYGALFVKAICGSYSNVRGLPLYELRCALEELGFFSHE